MNGMDGELDFAALEIFRNRPAHAAPLPLGTVVDACGHGDNQTLLLVVAGLGKGRARRGALTGRVTLLYLVLKNWEVDTIFDMGLGRIILRRVLSRFQGRQYFLSLTDSKSYLKCRCLWTQRLAKESW